MTALSFVWVHPYSQNSRCDINILLQPLVPSRCQMGKPKPPLHPCVTENKELSSDTVRLELISTYLMLQGCSTHFSGGGYTLRCYMLLYTLGYTLRHYTLLFYMACWLYIFNGFMNLLFVGFQLVVSI